MGTYKYRFQTRESKSNKVPECVNGVLRADGEY